ncbi:MAG: DegT/DnrJ/EryC1/StrS family aminotransferase [Eubacteriales bacterium]
MCSDDAGRGSGRRMNTPIVDFVKSYSESGIARFHMPGHKGRGEYATDITEIKGADELYGAHGIIAESENNATALFCSAHSYYSTEGSTLAIKAMLTLAASERPQGERPLFVAARNVHKSFVYGAAMLDAEVEWIYSDKGHVCRCNISPEMAESAISSCRRKPDGFYLTSPDYLGNMADVRGISEVCDRHGVPLLVDNAHGAYLAFLEENMHPILLGASMCADSAHKTLPVLTGGAYLHIAKKADRFCERARAALALYASTSPSYLILQSLDACNAYLAGSDGKRRAMVAEFVNSARVRLAEKHIVTEGGEPLKLVINAPASGYDGGELARFFRSMGIEPEFCDGDYTVLMVSELNGDGELARLSEALDRLEARTPIKREGVKAPRCRVGMSIRDAVFAPVETVDIKDAEGRICALPTVSCPPAVPIAVSGEIIDKDCIFAFAYYGLTHIEVVR